MSKTAAKLKEIGVHLPEAVKPAAAYVPYTVDNGVVYISGQLPLVDGKVSATGAVGAEVSVEQGQEVAKTCAINLLSQLRAACGGDLDRVEKVLKLVIFVNSASGFSDQHLVANGASKFVVEVLGDEVGSHARSAIGMQGLPMNVPVEVEGIFKIR